MALHFVRYCKRRMVHRLEKKLKNYKGVISDINALPQINSVKSLLLLLALQNVIALMD